MRVVTLLVTLLLGANTLACQEAAGPEEIPAFSVRQSGAGPGPTLVFIPGLSSPGAVWEDIVRHYEPTHPIEVLHLAGFAGAPPAPVISQSGPLLQPVRDQLIARLRDSARGRPRGAVLIGHSLGGLIALSVAAEAPQLLAGLVIVDGLPFLPALQAPGATAQITEPQAAAFRSHLRAQTKDQYAAFVRASHLELLVTRPADLERVITWALESDPATVGQAMYDVYVTDLRQQLGRIGAPTVVVAAVGGDGAGGAVSVQAIEAGFRQQYSTLAGVEVVSAPVRHFVMLDNPQWLRARIDSLLGRIAP